MSGFKLPKLVILRPKEYMWVNNLTKLAKQEDYLKLCLMDNCIDCRNLMNHPDIIHDKHNFNTIKWTVCIVRHLLIENAKIDSNESGYEYSSAWRE
jgi:hypothetical protein